eukprot:2145668-Pyramimonas_sp.AAC.1
MSPDQPKTTPASAPRLYTLKHIKAGPRHGREVQDDGDGAQLRGDDVAQADVEALEADGGQ